jgi:hypothetical protein
MGNRRSLLTLLMLGMSLFALCAIGFSQTGKGATVSFSGVIDRVHEKHAYLVVYEKKILLSSDTRILDENGNLWNVRELKPGQTVSIEALRSREGLIAKRIVVKTTKDW